VARLQAQITITNCHSQQDKTAAPDVTLLRALRPDVGGRGVTLSRRYWAGVPSGLMGAGLPTRWFLNCDQLVFQACPLSNATVLERYPLATVALDSGQAWKTNLGHSSEPPSREPGPHQTRRHASPVPTTQSHPLPQRLALTPVRVLHQCSGLVLVVNGNL